MSTQPGFILRSQIGQTGGVEPAGAAAGAIANHLAAPSPHSQYSLQSHKHTAAEVGADAAGAAAATLAAHVSAADPHIQYLTKSQFNNVITGRLTLINGWFSLSLNNPSLTRFGDKLVVITTPSIAKYSKPVSGEIIGVLGTDFRPTEIIECLAMDQSVQSCPFIRIDNSGRLTYYNDGTIPTSINSMRLPTISFIGV